MTPSASTLAPAIPIAHIDEPDAVAQLLDALHTLHGPDYAFAINTWTGDTAFSTAPDTIAYRFLIDTSHATIDLQPGDIVRGPSTDGPYRAQDDDWAETTAAHTAALWPGDVITATSGEQSVRLRGRATYFQVTTEVTGYRAPRLALLRNLTDFPGGCAAYEGAFRREAIPPQRPPVDATDARGVNRVNEHTLDTRMDRRPTPSRHHHGPVTVHGNLVNHTETAIVLPRLIYGLPEVDQPDGGHLVLYPNPQHDPANTAIVPVRPGSIVVTPATPARAVGHCFENVFAMLVAIPGFVSPYHYIETDSAGDNVT